MGSRIGLIASFSTVLNKTTGRAGRFLGIIVIPRYCNETISVSRRFRRNDNITISILLRFLVFVTAY